jgi:hypothetical protein
METCVVGLREYEKHWQRIIKRSEKYVEIKRKAG